MLRNHRNKMSSYSERVMLPASIDNYQCLKTSFLDLMTKSLTKYKISRIEKRKDAKGRSLKIVERNLIMSNVFHIVVKKLLLP